LIISSFKGLFDVCSDPNVSEAVVDIDSSERQYIDVKVRHLLTGKNK
jgi:hypothetical protein